MGGMARMSSARKAARKPLERDRRLDGKEGEEGERRDRPGGVGRVHRHQAAAAGVAEYEADAAAHHQRTEHHGERELGLA